MRPLPWLARRAAFMPLGVVFALGAALLLAGSLMAITEIPWARDGRVGDAEVIAKYIAPARSPKDVVDSRVVLRVVAVDGREIRGDLWYPVYMGWESLKIGDRVPVQYRLSGEARLASDARPNGPLEGASLALAGLVFIVVTGVPIFLVARDEQRAGRFDPRAVWGLLKRADPFG